MGGMISMYCNSAYSELFVASMYVDCHWDCTTFPELVKHKFVFSRKRSGYEVELSNGTELKLTEDAKPFTENRGGNRGGRPRK